RCQNASTTCNAVSASDGVSVDVEGKTQGLGEQEQAMAEGAMWSDQARAGQVVAEVKTLKRWLEPYHPLHKRVEEARELNELLESESGLDLALQRQLEQ